MPSTRPKAATPAENIVELTSVGVDVGTTTSHLIISKLIMTKTRTERKYEITAREILYWGDIFLTPLKNGLQIDMPKLVECFKADFEKSGISPESIDTGAVIITGESAKRQNAQEIVHGLSQEVGKFVCAAAGPNFESLLAARGSGAADYSMNSGKIVLNCDVGGGTSNLALVRNGEVVDTSCINVGARLIATDKAGKITRFEEPIQQIASALEIPLRLNTELTEKDKKQLASALQEALFDAITQDFTSDFGQMLMMTPLMSAPFSIDVIMFSGGVAEFIYGKTTKDYGDLGKYLAAEINMHKHALPAPVIEPPETIRATVIGAGQYTLQVSGITTYVDYDSLPLYNLLVVIPHIKQENRQHNQLVKAIKNAYRRLNLKPTEDLVALYFKGPFGGSYSTLRSFCKAVEEGVGVNPRRNHPLVMVFEKDTANSVGNVMVRETSITDNIVSIDELSVQEGDFIDIGVPREKGEIIPVIIKTLAFYKKI
ncbi:MAG: ethanolamine ammonia-lyase reactivating factor EutA [Candidatus Hodarchaeota archaeon]